MIVFIILNVRLNNTKTYHNMPTPKRTIFIGTNEIAGFGEMYADGFRKLGHTANLIIYRPDQVNRQYKADKILHLQKYPRPIRLVLMLKEFFIALFSYNTFIFLFGRTFLPGNADLPLLKLFKKDIIVVFLGCDIRQREMIKALNRPYAVCDDCTQECSYKQKRSLVNRIEKYADVIYAHPEHDQLLTRKYEYTYVPLDLSAWQATPSPVNTVFTILHAPSSTMKKGTPYIKQAINTLKKEGYRIDFRLLQNIPNHELKEHLKNADLVIDQLLQGWHGKLTIEAMALAKPVIVYISDDYQEIAHDMPIINTTKDSIYPTLKKLLEQEVNLAAISNASRKYVEIHNDHITICERMLATLDQ